MVDWHEAGRKAAVTRRRQAAARKAIQTIKWRAAGRKAAATRKRNAESKALDERGQSARALTIRQPWAELILQGRKPFELRSWTTKYRGPLVIHSAGKVDAEDAIRLGLDPDKLVTGAFVGVALLTDVRRYTRRDASLLKKKRGNIGGWYPDLFSWVLTKPRRISNPIKAKGRLGLIKIPISILRRIGKLPVGL